LLSFALLTNSFRTHATLSDGLCPTTIFSTQLGFYVYQFELSVCEPGTSITWNLDGGLLESSTGCMMVGSFAVGEYTITATFTDEDCPGNGTGSLSVTIVVNGPPPCSENLVLIEQLDFNTFSFSMPEGLSCFEGWQAASCVITNQFAAVVYTNASSCSPVVDFEEPGLYYYTSNLYGIGFCDTVSFVVDEFDDGICPDEIVVTILGADYVEFSIPGLEAGIPVSWNFGDGIILVDDWAVEHLYDCEQFCSYVITASFVDPDCPGDGGANTLTLNFDFDSPYYCPEGLIINTLDCNSFEVAYDASEFVDLIITNGT